MGLGEDVGLGASSIPPQDGLGMEMPSPDSLWDDLVRMAEAMLLVEATSTGEKTLRAKCRVMTQLFRAPSPSGGQNEVPPRRLRTSARTMRATPIHENRPMVTTSVRMPAFM